MNFVAYFKYYTFACTYHLILFGVVTIIQHIITTLCRLGTKYILKTGGFSISVRLWIIKKFELQKLLFPTQELSNRQIHFVNIYIEQKHSVQWQWFIFYFRHMVQKKYLTFTTSRTIFGKKVYFLLFFFSKTGLLCLTALAVLELPL